MSASLLDLLGGRFIFAVGKGGVGKTTAASAVALALAERSDAVHLVSTDPAHSVGDVFGRTLVAGVPTPSDCHPRLTLEELDAVGGSRRWLDEIAAPLAELIDLGTYLDRGDIDSLVQLSLPGVDELMGALRLAELAGGASGRVVIDTAPTGHTLRLLEAGSLLDGWARAFEAIAAKAGAVQEHLIRRRIRFEGEELMDRLRARLRSFHTEVLQEADFLLVSRGDPVVLAESGRLGEELRSRGLRVAAELRVGGCGPASAPVRGPLVDVAWCREPIGCEGLRRWAGGARVRSRDADQAAEGISLPAPSSHPAPVSDRAPGQSTGYPVPPELLERELLFFVGKGGVGKSTCAAATALTLARGRPVLLLSTDPAGSLEDLLGVPIASTRTAPAADGLGEGLLSPGVPGPPEKDRLFDAAGLPGIPRPADRAGPPSGLRARQMDAGAEFEAFRRRYEAEIRELFERWRLDGSAYLDRRVLESLLALAPPGLDEIFALHAILEECEDDRILIVDSAPTGHFLRMVEMPELALDWTHAILRILLKYRSVLGLDEAAVELLRFARRLRALLDLLRDARRAGVVMVTLEEPVVARESERLHTALAAAGLSVVAVVRNRASPSGAPSPLETDPPPGGSATRIRAPTRGDPPIGAEALIDFFRSWELET